MSSTSPDFLSCPVRFLKLNYRGNGNGLLDFRRGENLRCDNVVVTPEGWAVVEADHCVGSFERRARSVVVFGPEGEGEPMGGVTFRQGEGTVFDVRLRFQTVSATKKMSNSRMHCMVSAGAVSGWQEGEDERCGVSQLPSGGPAGQQRLLAAEDGGGGGRGDIRGVGHHDHTAGGGGGPRGRGGGRRWERGQIVLLVYVC